MENDRRVAEVKIVNVSVITEEGVLERGWIHFGREGILGIGRMDEAADRQEGEAHANGEISGEVSGQDEAGGAEIVIDGRGGWVVPGFIDVHVHGAVGFEFMDAAAEAFDRITEFHAAHGTTAMLATTVTAPKGDIDNVLRAVGEYVSGRMPFARLLGVHLEGPFISREYPGAQNPAFIVPPDLSWVKEWHERYGELMRILTLAPEIEGADRVIEWCAERGVVIACGHSAAGYDRMMEAKKRGLRHSVHMFNGMRGFHHREPGTAGAILADEAISAEIIADGHHVHPAAIRVLADMKRKGNLLMITDAIAAAGFGEGEYRLGGMEVVVRGGVAKLKDGSSLAGSTLSMDAAFRYLVREVGLDPALVSRMASGNPARLLGLSDRMGWLAAGFPSDIVLFSPDFEVERVWVKGRAIERSHVG